MATLSPIEIKEALVDIRKAHRLLFEYQRRIMDVMYFVQDKLRFPSNLTGNRLFFDPIRYVRSSYGQFNVHEIWAWDFIYSYIFEFYLGSKTCKKEGRSFRCDLSVVEVSDTGYLESRELNKDFRETNSYLSPESASSVLIFMVQTKPEEVEENIWQDRFYVRCKVEEMFTDKKNELVEEKGDIVFCAKKYYISDFFNQRNAETTVQEFIELVKRNTGVEMV